MAQDPWAWVNQQQAAPLGNTIQVQQTPEMQQGRPASDPTGNMLSGMATTGAVNALPKAWEAGKTAYIGAATPSAELSTSLVPSATATGVAGAEAATAGAGALGAAAPAIAGAEAATTAGLAAAAPVAAAATEAAALGTAATAAAPLAATAAGGSALAGMGAAAPAAMAALGPAALIPLGLFAANQVVKGK
jgi:hypothetical protein